MKTHKFFFIGLIVLLNNCSYSQPDSRVINDNVKKYYFKISLADGSPSYDVKQIKIDTIYQVNKDTFTVKVTVNGTSVNHSLPDQSERDNDFENNQTFLFFKNSYHKWECEIKYD